MNDQQESPATRGAKDEGLSLFLAGDTILTVPWSEDTNPRFKALVDALRAADATVVNLETLIHEYRGYAQADSGGVHMASPPAIAGELAWAGVDMVAHANNHSFDYGSTGILETNQHLREAGVFLAGSGADLQNARAPRFFEHQRGTVGLVAMASTFPHYGKASASRPDMHGRPGLNPLSIESGKRVSIPRWAANLLVSGSRAIGRSGGRFEKLRFRMMGQEVQVAERFSYANTDRIAERDLTANLAAIRQARRKAELVIASLHNHRRAKLGWLTRFAHTAIDEGADVFFLHGEHRVGGVEIYNGRPILHGLGNFVFQIDLIERLPVEYYERFGLGDDATPAEVFAMRSANRTRGFTAKKSTYEGVAAQLRFEAGRLSELRLLPLDLNFDAAPPVWGRPYLAEPAHGVAILKQVQTASDRYGTKIEVDEATGAGRVRLE